MIVWIYVEGESDKLALQTLWKNWRIKLGQAKWGICIVPLDSKAQFFRKIGARTVEKLTNNKRDLVVGLPDLYPNLEYRNGEYEHNTLKDLLNLQVKLVSDALGSKVKKKDEYLKRFFPSALKHDLEMLILAAVDSLRKHLGTDHHLGKWVHPVEDQNQNNPPKRIVESLYKQHKKRRYRDTTDSVAIFNQVSALSDVLYSKTNQLQCPVFKEMLDWVEKMTKVSVL